MVRSLYPDEAHVPDGFTGFLLLLDLRPHLARAPHHRRDRAVCPDMTRLDSSPPIARVNSERLVAEDGEHPGGDARSEEYGVRAPSQVSRHRVEDRLDFLGREVVPRRARLGERLAAFVRLGLVDVAVLEVRAVEDGELADEVLWRGWDPAGRGCDSLQLWNTQCKFGRV